MINCQKCDYLIPLRMYVGKSLIDCPSCKKSMQIFIFPELLKPLAKGGSGEKAIEGLDASCFVHADKKAKSVCNQCGSYICELCEIPKADKIVCSKCFNREDKRETKSPFDKTYRQHSKVASTLVIVSVVLWFVSIILAPIALFISLRHMNAKEGFFCGSRIIIKIILAIISFLILLSWVVFFVLWRS